MESSKMSDVRSDEEFDRAAKKIRDSFHNLDVVEKTVLKHFVALCPLHELALLPGSGNHSFQLYVFYEHDKDIEDCKQSGVTQDILDDLYNELEQAGRGTRDSITVRIEVDSNENVVAKYQGDYDRRLH